MHEGAEEGTTFREGAKVKTLRLQVREPLAQEISKYSVNLEDSLGLFKCFIPISPENIFYLVIKSAIKIYTQLSQCC